MQHQQPRSHPHNCPPEGEDIHSGPNAKKQSGGEASSEQVEKDSSMQEEFNIHSTASTPSKRLRREEPKVGGIRGFMDKT